MEFTEAGLRAIGFEGFIRWAELARSDLPALPGVYVVIRVDMGPLELLPKYVTPKHESVRPPYSLTDITDRWLEQAAVVYVGKAGGDGIAATIKSRIWQFRSFWSSPANRNHSGGRAIWQIGGAAERLAVCWLLTIGQPSKVEDEMLEEFERYYGQEPFANRAPASKARQFARYPQPR